MEPIFPHTPSAMLKTNSKNMFGATTVSGFNKQTHNSFDDNNPLNDKIDKEMI
jgi:hypothetical protein